MNPSLGIYTLESFKQYLDYRLLADLSAFSNKTVNLYNYPDKAWTSKNVYGSSYAQWVYHSGFGATTVSGVQNPGFQPKSTGLFVDYNNGRIIKNSTLTGNPTANVAVSEINTYLTTKSDSQIVGETNFLSYPDIKPADTYLPPYSNVISAAYIRMQNTENQPLSLGGTDWTAYKIRVICVCKNNYHLTAMADTIRDMGDMVFPIITGQYSWPFNEYGDLKSGYDYNSYLENPPIKGFIDRSSFGYIQNDIFSKNNPSFEVGIGTLDVRIPRNPHN